MTNQNRLWRARASRLVTRGARRTGTRFFLFACVSALGIVESAPAHAQTTPPSYIQQFFPGGSNDLETLTSESNTFCYLAGVSGAFVGGGEAVEVFPGSQGSWQASVQSQQGGAEATVNCVAISAFQTEVGGPSNVGSVFWYGTNSQNTGPSGGFAWVTGTMWQGDSVAMVSGITGQFDGGGEFVEVSQATTASAYNQINVQAESPNGVGGWEQALFLGKPGTGFLPTFYGPNGSATTAANAGIYTASASAGSQPAAIVMAPTDAAVCFLTKIGGAFAGGGERVQIGTDTWIGDGLQHWFLDVWSQQPNGTSASAICYALDQTWSQ